MLVSNQGKKRNRLQCKLCLCNEREINCITGKVCIIFCVKRLVWGEEIDNVSS
jgi:hypothetical protein